MDTSEVIDDILSRSSTKEEEDALFVEGFLSHFGVKGMQWGVRKAVSERWSAASKANVQRHYARRSARTAKRKEKEAAKAGRPSRGKRFEAWAKEVGFVGNANSDQTRILIQRTAATRSGHDVQKINKKPEYARAARRGDLLNPNNPTTIKYHKEVHDMYMKNLQSSARDIVGAKSPAGKSVVVEKSDNRIDNPQGFEIVLHADNPIVGVRFIYDKDGFIVGFEPEDDTMAQGAMFIDDYLAHFGVKGMQWGVRRKATVGAREVIVRDSRFPGSKRLVTKGGEGHPATSEAISSRKIGQIAKGSGTKALSNKQLEEYNKRLNLEQNFSRLHYQDKNAGQKFVATLLGQSQRHARDAGDAVASHQIRKRLEKRGLVAVSKKAAKAAAVAAV